MILSSLFHGEVKANEGFEVDSIINNLREMPQAKAAIDGVESLGERSYLLRIFVSSSMPKPLLKAYALEATKYNGVLVFKGLPDGSFRAMSDLVSYLSSMGDESMDTAKETNLAIQIDDEVFDKFNITSVPTFVLSQERECYDLINCKNVYDKISGNLGLKAVLEKFAKDGELKAASTALLKQAESKQIINKNNE